MIGASNAGRIYLDYNATAPIRPEAQAAVAEAIMAGNPSSVHEEGRKARALVETARKDIAQLCGGLADAVVFTSGGTEACNMAMHLRDAPAGPVQRVIVSAIEHSAVAAPAQASGLPVETVPALANGQVDIAALAALFEEPTPALVCIMLANNETGVIQPLAEIADMVKGHGSLLFCDAVQAAGKVPLDMTAMGVDALSLSGHKLGAPMGVGALVTRPGLPVAPSLLGGGQELGRRAGSENIIGIAGFAAAAKAAMAGLSQFAELASARDAMESALRASSDDIVIFGADSPRLPNTSCFARDGLNSETLVMAMDLAGFSVSAGAACSSGKVSRSHVLAAMGVEDRLSNGVLRVSMGWQSGTMDSLKLAEAWARVALRQAA